MLGTSNTHQAQVHQSRSTRSTTPPSTLNLHVTYQLASDHRDQPPATHVEGPPISQPTLPPQPPTSKYSRFEQLIKSLVGRKVSRDTSINSIAPNTTQQQNTPTPTILQSPEILITPSPPERPLIKNDRNSSSTASLNAAVQQKLWSVVPLLRKEGSCVSLNQIRQSGASGSSSSAGLKKCDTFLALSRSSSNLEQPIRPMNRLRDSTSSITCSRCSSLLSLAANGSRYSLNLSSGGGFVAVGGTSKTPSPGFSSNTFLSPASAVPIKLTCKLCLIDVAEDQQCVIGHCGCTFCTEVSFVILILFSDKYQFWMYV